MSWRIDSIWRRPLKPGGKRDQIEQGDDEEQPERHRLRARYIAPSRLPQDQDQQEHREELEDQQRKRGLPGSEQGRENQQGTEQPLNGGFARAGRLLHGR